MDANHGVERSARSPEFVFTALKDLHLRLLMSWHCQDLSPETTVDELSLLQDDANFEDFVACYSRFFNIDCSIEEWRTAWEPMTERTLRDVCALIASGSVDEPVLCRFARCIYSGCISA